MRTILGEKIHAENAQPAVKSAEAVAMIKTALGHNFLFKHLEEAGLEEAVLYMTQEAVAEGAVVIQQGSKGEFFCVCQSGSYDVLVDGTKVGGSPNVRGTSHVKGAYQHLSYERCHGWHADTSHAERGGAR